MFESSRASSDTRIPVNFVKTRDPSVNCSRLMFNLNIVGQQNSRAAFTELAEIAVELARKPDGARDARQASRDLVGQKLYFERIIKNKSIPSV